MNKTEMKRLEAYPRPVVKIIKDECFAVRRMFHKLRKNNALKLYKLAHKMEPAKRRILSDFISQAYKQGFDDGCEFTQKDIGLFLFSLQQEHIEKKILKPTRKRKAK